MAVAVVVIFAAIIGAVIIGLSLYVIKLAYSRKWGE
jgi:hypothetical protein